MRKKQLPFASTHQGTSALDYSRTLSRGEMQHMHQHDRYELSVLVGGSGWCYFEDEVLHMSSGALYILPPGVSHMMRYASDMPHEMYHIYFSPSLLEHLRIEFDVDLRDSLPCRRALPLSEELKVRLEQTRPLLGAQIGSLDQSILYLAIQCVLLTIAKQLETEPLPSGASHPSVRESMRFLSAHFVEDITLSQLAQLCGLTPSYLCRLFKQETGLSPTEYLLQIRVQNACRLLEKTGFSISQVALQSGFNSTTYFDRRFRQMMGISPSNYISQHRR